MKILSKSKPRTVDSPVHDSPVSPVRDSPVSSIPEVPTDATVKTVTHLKGNSETPVVPHRVVTLDPLETPVPVSAGVREQERMLLGDLA